MFARCRCAGNGDGSNGVSAGHARRPLAGPDAEDRKRPIAVGVFLALPVVLLLLLVLRALGLWGGGEMAWPLG